MFVNMLLDEEKIGFVWLLQYLSQLDGKITEEDELYLKSVCNKLDVKSEEIMGEFPAASLEEILAQIQTPVSKNVVIMELINLAFADKDYSTKEREGIKYIASEIGVLEDKVVEIEEWVKDGISWANRGYHMISSPEGVE